MAKLPRLRHVKYVHAKGKVYAYFNTGKNPPGKPAWTTIGALIAEGIECKAYCRKCEKWKPVDLVKLAEYKGLDYDLWNKLTHCRMTPGCVGPVIFFENGRGYMTKMVDSY